jgi:hypothetical protein
MSYIKFRCDYRKSEKTTNECYACSRLNKCELYLDMATEEEDRSRDEEEVVNEEMATV